MDLRIERTYKSITDTFIEFLNEMPLEQIKITDLCQQSMIRRATFYRHFNDKYECYRCVVSRMIDRIDTAGIEMSPMKYCRAIICGIAYFLEDYPGITGNLCISTMLSLQTTYLSEILNEKFYRYFEECIRKGYSFSVQPFVCSKFLAGGLSMAIQQWILQGEPYLAAELLSDVDELMNTVRIGQSSSVSGDGQTFSHR